MGDQHTHQWASWEISGGILSKHLYCRATERMSFLKYPIICELESKHGVDIGVSYTNERSGRTFVHYIAEAKRQDLSKKVVSAKFYSLLIDISTDKGNFDNKAVLTVWCDPNGSNEKVHTRVSYLSLIRKYYYLEWTWTGFWTGLD